MKIEPSRADHHKKTEDFIRIEVIRSKEAMKAISKPWNDLLVNSRSNTIFLTWEWLFTWAEFFLREENLLFVLTIYKGKRLIGIVPWCIHKVRRGNLCFKQIEFLGTQGIGSDYLDVISQKGKEEEVAQSIYQFLFQEGASYWDCLKLQDIRSNSFFLLHLLNKIGEVGKHVEINAGAFSPVLILPNSYGEFWNGLSQNRREQFLRHQRLLKQKGSVEYKVVFPKMEAESKSLKTFLTLFNKNWNHIGEPFYQFLEKFIARSKEKENVQIDFLKVNGIEVASLFQLRYSRTLSMYLMATDRSFYPKISVGNILIGLTIERAIKENIRVYDFLKGSERYKFHWSNSGNRSINFTFYQKNWRNFFLLAGRSLKDLARVISR